MSSSNKYNILSELNSPAVNPSIIITQCIIAYIVLQCNTEIHQTKPFADFRSLTLVFMF